MMYDTANAKYSDQTKKDKTHHCVVGFKVTMRRSSILAAFTTFVSFAFQKSTFAASFVDPVNGY